MRRELGLCARKLLFFNPEATPKHARFVNKNGVKNNRCLQLSQMSASLWTWRGCMCRASG